MPYIYTYVYTHFFFHSQYQTFFIYCSITYHHKLMAYSKTNYLFHSWIFNLVSAQQDFHLYSSWLGLLNCFGRPTSKIAYSYDLQLGALPVSLHTGLSTGWPGFPQSIMSRLQRQVSQESQVEAVFFFFMFIVSQKSSNVTVHVCSVAKPCLTLRDPKTCRLLCPWDFPGKNTAVTCHFLLQGT